MKPSLYQLSLTIAFFCCAVTLCSQSTRGTEFWLGYMENLNLAFNDQPVFTIVVDANASTAGSISVPQTGLLIPFTANAGVTEIELPTAIFYTAGSEVIDNKGLLITTDLPVQIQAQHYRLFFSESSNLLSSTELGDTYIVTTPLDDTPSNHPASFVIVATEDNTQVEITPTALTLGLRPANLSFTVTLDRGQNYQVQSLGDLTGSQIRSLNGAQLAVFSGAMQANIGPCTGGADSHIWDQCLPVNKWDEIYHFVPFSGQGGDRIRIVAGTDNTEVYFDCGLETTLNAGEVYEVQTSLAQVITSSFPISLTQYNNGATCNASGLGDPNGLTYLPTSYKTTNTRWLATDRMSGFSMYFSSHFVTIIAPEAALNDVLLDGGAVGDFQPFAADDTYYFTRLAVAPGAHEITSVRGIQAYAYGFGDFDAYTLNLGYSQEEAVPYSCLNVFAEGVFCQDSLINFTFESPLDLVDFSWSFGDNSFSEDANPTHQYATPGTYTILLEARDVNGVLVNASTVVVVEDCSVDCTALGITGFEVTGRACVDSLLLIEAVAFGGVGELRFGWLLPDGERRDEATLQNLRFTEAGLYQIELELMDSLGCTANSSLDVTIVECQDTVPVAPQVCQLMWPNAFSPNQDGVNDEFRAFFEQACTPNNFFLQVFNRWGGLVYETNDPNQAWNGDFLGRPHPAGILVYRCSYSTNTDEVVSVNGDLLLIK